VLDLVYRAAAWQRVDQFRYNIAKTAMVKINNCFFQVPEVHICMKGHGSATWTTAFFTLMLIESEVLKEGARRKLVLFPYCFLGCL
jgi:hypothetical protein